MHMSRKNERKNGSLEIKCPDIHPFQDDGDGLCVGYKKGQGHSVARGDIVALVNYKKMTVRNEKPALVKLRYEKRYSFPKITILLPSSV